MNVRALRAVLLVTGVLTAWALVLWLGLGEFPAFVDLAVYRAGGYAWTVGVPLYGPELPALVELVPLPFLYPPISAVLFAPLSVLPFSVAAVLLTAASLVCLALVGWLTARRLGFPGRRATQFAAAAVVLGTLTEPVRETFFFGQVNLLLMGLVVADCLLPRTFWPRGALIGLAAAIKLTPAVFVLFFLAHRQWRPVLVAGTSSVAVTAVGCLAAPADSARYWLGGVLAVPSWINPAFPSNQSMAGLLHRWLLPAPWHTVIWVGALAAVLAAGWVAVRRWRGCGQDVTALLAVAAVSLLASPLSWSHHYVWVVPALIWGVRQAWSSPRWAPAVVVLAGVFLTGPHWLVAGRADHQPDWGPGEQVVGNTYVWLALLVAMVGAVRLIPHGPIRRGPRLEPGWSPSVGVQPPM